MHSRQQCIFFGRTNVQFVSLINLCLPNTVVRGLIQSFVGQDAFLWSLPLLLQTHCLGTQSWWAEQGHAGSKEPYCGLFYYQVPYQTFSPHTVLQSFSTWVHKKQEPL